MLQSMPGWAKVAAFVILTGCFWHFFYQDEPIKALGFELGALWLVFREAKSRLEDRSGPTRRRGKFPE